MKVCLVFVALLSLGMCATVLDLIHHEVQYLYQSDPNMTIDHCTTKCDALFDLIANHDEDRTDKACHYECSCQKNNNCHHHRHTTTRPTVAA